MTSSVSILQTMRTNHHIYLWLCYWRHIWFTVFAHFVSFIFYYHQPWKIWNWRMLLLNMVSCTATLNSKKKKKGKLKHHQYKPMCVPFIVQWRLSVKIEIFLMDCHFFFNFPNLLWHWYLSLWTEAPEKEPHLHWPFYKGLLIYSNLNEWGDFELFWIQRLITWNVHRSLVSTNRKAKDGIRQHLKPTQGFPHFAVICLPDVSTNFILLVYDFFFVFFL